MAENFKCKDEKIAKLMHKNTTRKNTSQQMKTAIWRISTTINIPWNNEFAKEKANEDRNFTSINVEKTIIIQGYNK